MAYRQTRIVAGKKVPTGTMMIDRRFRGIGRIKVASGTLSKPTINMYNAALTDLFNTGQFEPLRALKEKWKVGRGETVTPKMVYDWWRDRTQSVPWAKGSINAHEALKAFIDNKGGARRLADTTCRMYQARLNVLEDKYTISALALREVPQVLEKYQRECEAMQPPQETAFRNTRAFVQGCVGDTLGEDSDTYKAIVKMGLVVAKGIIRKQRNNPFTPADLDVALRNCDDKEFKNILWFMCCVGCGPKEFFVDGWQFESDKLIRVYGVKNHKRYNRPVPVVFRKLRPDPKAIGVRMFYKKFLQLFPSHTPYDCRRTFQTWCLKAGIDRMHFKVYAGHSLSISEHYTEEDVERWIDKDRVLLADYINRQRTEIDDFDYKELDIADHPSEVTNNLQEKKVSYFIEKLNGYLEMLQRNNQMRKRYRVEVLIDIDEEDKKAARVAKRELVTKAKMTARPKAKKR